MLQSTETIDNALYFFTHFTFLIHFTLYLSLTISLLLILTYLPTNFSLLFHY